MEWIGIPDEITKEDYAIVYRITNIIDNRQYIGKKQLWSRIKRKPLKGKKRNRIDHKLSDYNTYYGSSTELQEDVKKYGEDNFKREVLHIAKSKWEAAYVELYYQIKEQVLFKEEYYNGIINVRLPKPPRDLDTNKLQLLLEVDNRD